MRGEHGRTVLRAFLSEYRRGQELRWSLRYGRGHITVRQLLGLDQRERALRSSLRQRAEQMRRHAAKLEMAVEEERWPAAIQHINDLMHEERQMAYALLAWIFKLLET